LNSQPYQVRRWSYRQFLRAVAYIEAADEGG